MSADATSGWSLSGTYFESCNCDSACPCVSLSEPTEGDCTVLVGWHIDEGHADGVLAGLFQLTPWKQSCLLRCRTPVGFLIAEWRDGARGALVMGIRHGAYCVGCCWLLMAVLFVVGTMHLVWMAAIAVFVLAEKVAPRALRVSYASAVVLVGWGASTLLAAGA